MKPVLALLVLLAAASAWAQVPPAPAPPREAERTRVNYEAQVPRDAMGNEKVPPAKQASNAELTDLLRKQTAAIQALNGKLGELEARVLKLERGAR